MYTYETNFSYVMYIHILCTTFLYLYARLLISYSQFTIQSFALLEAFRFMDFKHFFSSHFFKIIFWDMEIHSHNCRSQMPINIWAARI